MSCRTDCRSCFPFSFRSDVRWHTSAFRHVQEEVVALLRQESKGAPVRIPAPRRRVKVTQHSQAQLDMVLCRQPQVVSSAGPSRAGPLP